ncbi:DUF937 domain-containing protein [Albibacterium indicum]|uniref:DUF937 domain-containing protein n=1 Tax=Albibacterium indicum TaxID=2292082 RepID=UPI000E4D8AE9|nr:DUF937 domain-containing protein [Pedobacter indicus]
MNLIEMIKEEIDGSVLSSISQKAGISEEQAENGFSVAIPAVLGGILKNNDGENSGLLSGLFVQGTTDDQPTEDDSQLLDRGSAMASNLFGTERESLTNELSNATGLNHDRSSGLLAMIVPTITGLISKLMTKHNWNFSDVLGRVVSSKDEIFSSLPTGLRNSFGLADIGVPQVPDVPESPIIETDTPEVDLPPTDFPKTDTPPTERSPDTEGAIEVPPAPIPPLVDEPEVVEEPKVPEVDEVNVTNEPLETIEDTPVREEPLEPEIMEAELTDAGKRQDESLNQEPVTPETVAREAVVEQEVNEPEQIPPRAAIPPEPPAKSGGMLRWVLIIVLIILILWWLL